MILTIPNIAAEAILDDDPRLEHLRGYTWTASYCRGFKPGGKGYYVDGLYVAPPASLRRAYPFIKRQWREGKRVRSESLQAAVLVALGRALPVGKERIFFGPLGHLNFTSANLLVRTAPWGGYYILPRKKF